MRLKRRQLASTEVICYLLFAADRQKIARRLCRVEIVSRALNFDIVTVLSRVELPPVLQSSWHFVFYIVQHFCLLLSYLKLLQMKFWTKIHNTKQLALQNMLNVEKYSKS